MAWTLEQLRSFVAAAEHGSFSAAARAGGRAQSVVSAHIALLEADLGVDLFRRGHMPTLTEAGALLLVEARECSLTLRLCAPTGASCVVWARWNGCWPRRRVILWPVPDALPTTNWPAIVRL